MPAPVARRLWIVPEAPPDLVSNCPEGYGAGICALAYGGTPDGMPPTGWITNLPAILGLTPEAANTLVCRHAGAFLWTAYWDPTGQVTPAEPKIQIWPPE
jgi:hypothetical protein